MAVGQNQWLIFGVGAPPILLFSWGLRFSLEVRDFDPWPYVVDFFEFCQVPGHEVPFCFLSIFVWYSPDIKPNKTTHRGAICRGTLFGKWTPLSGSMLVGRGVLVSGTFSWVIWGLEPLVLVEVKRGNHA